MSSNEATSNLKSLHLENLKQIDDLKPPPAEAGKWFSTRYCLAYLAFFGFANVYALRVNLSVAVLSMTNNTYMESFEETKVSQAVCEANALANNVTQKDGEFKWDESQRSLILSSFFYGYFLTAIPGGYLAARYGGKWVFGGGVFGTAFLTLLTPLAARSSFGLLITARVLTGFVEGVTFPAMHSMWGKWAPPVERSFLVSITYAGAQFGTVITQPVAGILCSSDFLGGWPSVFYVFGALGIVWSIIWSLTAHSSPEEHPRISSAELSYLQSTVHRSDGNKDVPWISIMTSGPVWAIALSHFSNNWGFYTLLTCLPIYLKDILQFDISKSGFLAGLPYLVMWISINVNGYLADKVREKRILSTTETRKVFNSLGLLGPALFLVAASLVGCNQSAAVACICLATCFNACVLPGCNANHIDLSPKHAGILMGMSNTVANIAGFVSPGVVGALTEDNNTQGQWQVVFIISAAVYVFGTVVFLLLASGEEQKWSKEEHEPLIKDAPCTN